jgi:gliding motility-associated protein GldC
MSELKKSQINFNILLDKENIPEHIDWLATDAGMDSSKPCKAIMISLWDEDENNALRMDLWTKKMMVEEMNMFYFQTLMTMADSYITATGNKELADELKHFGNHFAEKTEIFKNIADPHAGHNHGPEHKH